MRAQHDRSRRATTFVAVVVLHLLVLWWLALTRDVDLIVMDPPIELILFPTPPSGGGSPSLATAGETATAPSAVHVPVTIRKSFPEAFRAPPEPAPQPEIVIGAAAAGAPVIAPSEALANAGLAVGAGVAAEGGAGHQGVGLAGAGTGTGSGVGSGNGSGVGASSGVRWIRKLNAEEKREVYPSLAARRRISGEAVILCRINRDTTVTRCRSESEKPTGQGFGRAAVRAAQYMRIRPRVVNGVVQDGARERITVPFVWTSAVSPEDALPR